MKANRITIVALCLVALLAFNASKPLYKFPDKNYKEVSHRFYASAYEVTNQEFRSYLTDLKINNKTEDYKKNYPDTTQWMKKFPNSFNEPWVEQYFSHPGFDNYPVVNITKEAADGYCKWLTEKYNSQVDKQYKKVTFRLPTEQEWNRMASVLPGHNLPWYGGFAYEATADKYCANVKFKNQWSETNKFDYLPDGALTTNQVGAYEANKIGLYDMIGNVAEITGNGSIKGGSWDNTIDECVVNKTQDFLLPDPRVGFRVVMIIEEL